MSEQMKKLMQELVTLFAKPIATYHPSLGLIYPTIHKKLAAELAKDAVAQTLKAVANGMPLSDEIDRGALWKNTITGEWEVCRQDASKWPEEGYVNFIGLSPTATGKEEEGA